MADPLNVGSSRFWWKTKGFLCTWLLSITHKTKKTKTIVFFKKNRIKDILKAVIYLLKLYHAEVYLSKIDRHLMLKFNRFFFNPLLKNKLGSSLILQINWFMYDLTWHLSFWFSCDMVGIWMRWKWSWECERCCGAHWRGKVEPPWSARLLWMWRDEDLEVEPPLLMTICKKKNTSQLN